MVEAMISKLWETRSGFGIGEKVPSLWIQLPYDIKRVKGEA